MIEVSELSKTFNSLVPSRIDRLTERLFARADQGTERPNLEADLIVLLKKGAEVNARRAYEGGTVLNIICGQGLSDVARMLVEKAGADVNLTNDKGTTAMIMAAWAADATAMAMLLDKGASATAKNIGGQDPLGEILHGTKAEAKEPGRQLECLKLLQAHGVTLSAEDKKYIYLSRPDLAPGVPDIADAMALEKAIKDGKLNDVQKLLARKVDPDGAAAFGGDTAMYFAAAYGRVDIIKELKEAGADVNKESPGCKWLPLQVAVNNGWNTSIETLLDLGADPLLKTDNGKSLIDYARTSEDSKMEDFLTTLLAPRAQMQEPDVTLPEKMTTMPRLRLKNAKPA